MEVNTSTVQPASSNLFQAVYCFLFVVAGIDEGFSYINTNGRGWRVSSPDVPLACIVTSEQEATVFPVPLTTITSPVKAVAFNLYNNIWNTNYILWYPFAKEDGDFKARFSVERV